MQILILGNGIAGITAARTLRKYSDHPVTVISGESRYFIARTALMYVYMGFQQRQDLQPYPADFWTKNRIHLVQDQIQKLDLPGRKLLGGGQYPFDRLLLAPGSVPDLPPWPGLHLIGVQGFYHLHDLENLERLTPSIRKAVIIGGGLIAIELAEMLHSRGIHVTLLVREKGFASHLLPDEESALVGKEIERHGVTLRLRTSVAELQDRGDGRIGAVLTTSGEAIPCDFAGMATGVKPNIYWLTNSGLELNKGILVDPFLRTNHPQVFAAGDAAELRQPPPERRAIETQWYTGRIMGETAAANILDKSQPYQPGGWFNSAKFFSLEYQAYGTTAWTAPGIHSLQWQKPGTLHSLRLFWYPNNNRFCGAIALGIRLRQETMEQWIANDRPLSYVLAHLHEVFFNPEGSADLTIPIQEYFRQQLQKD